MESAKASATWILLGAPCWQMSEDVRWGLRSFSYSARCLDMSTESLPLMKKSEEEMDAKLKGSALKLKAVKRAWWRMVVGKGSSELLNSLGGLSKTRLNLKLTCDPQQF